jgi:hypothetical protein
MDQLDLFVSLYDGSTEIATIPDSQTMTAVSQCFRFLEKCVKYRLVETIDPSHEVYVLAHTIREHYANFDQIRVYVLTDRKAKAKNFKPREVNGKTIKLEVMDIERLYRHWSEGKPRDEIVVNFEQVSGEVLPCVYIPGEKMGYDYALTVIPGEALYFAYEKYGARLLEANVRSFLSVTGKVNKGIRDTIKNDPDHFMAYNNGIVVVADEVTLGRTSAGGPGILWIKGMQVVNGGQTTASVYFTKKKNPDVDLRCIRVPAKIIVLKSNDLNEEETLISNISKYANTQNSVKQSDLSANKPFHVEIEKLSTSTYCPDGVGRWFYERAAGSYKTMLAREGTTPARLRNLKQAVPPARKITKTDLAKYLNSWDQMPDSVSFGAQKNFIRFMEKVGGGEPEMQSSLVDVAEFKKMIAKTIFFKETNKLVNPMFPAGHPKAQVTTYLVSLAANLLGDRVDLEKIWALQGLSPELKQQLKIWASEINEVLHKTANGRMVSEWSKKSACWDAVRTAHYSSCSMDDIPETR